MALRFVDSFDHYVTADLLKKWTTSVNSPAITASIGRNSTDGLRMASTAGAQRSLTKTIDTQASWVLGVAFRYMSSITATQPIMGLLDAGSIQVDVRINTSGNLLVTRNGTTLATGTTVLTQSVHYFIEFKATINNTGSYELRINGVSELSNGSVDTQATANASANQVQLAGGAASGAAADFDDFYACDGTGGVNDNFLGDVRVEALFPNGNGNSSQFDGSDGNQVDNYLLVDEAAQDGDTTYVESPDVNDKDTYAFTNLSSGTGTIYGVQILPYARKNDAGTRSIKTVARLSGGTEADGPEKTLTTSYQYLYDIRETRPGGGSWTVTDVNGSEFGQKVFA